MTALIDRTTCSALVITCSDFRFKSAETAFARTAGLVDDYDLIARPGAARLIVAPRSEAARETLLGEIHLLWNVHHFRRVLLVNHISCRAYDDIATPADQHEIHRGHLQRAAAAMETLYETIAAEAYLVDMVDGALAATTVIGPHTR